jgi:hypothetical protein
MHRHLLALPVHLLEFHDNFAARLPSYEPPNLSGSEEGPLEIHAHIHTNTNTNTNTAPTPSNFLRHSRQYTLDKNLKREPQRWGTIT